MKVEYCWIGALLLLDASVLSSASGKYVNTPCQADSDCGLDNLQCINNFCQCDSHTQIYDQSTNKCLLLIGQQCQSPVYTAGSNGQFHPDPTSQPIKCVPHADCTKSICRCKQGYKPSLDLLCKPDFGSPCYVKEDCDDTLGLVCTHGICQCFNNTWTYQGQFGCVDPQDPTYNEMLRLLNQTHHLLKENNLEIRDMFNELGLQNDPNSEFIFGNAIADERQFRDSYNTHDLQFAAQNQSPQTSGGGNGFNLQQLLSLFQTLQSFIPRNNNNNNNGGGGNNNNGAGLNFLRTLRNLFGGGNNNNQGGGGNQGGYPESSSPPPSGGYGAPGQAEMGQRMSLINSFLNLFNQLIPVVRQLKMRFSPFKFIQNVLNRLAPSTETPPPAPAVHNPPPTLIQSNGNFHTNPIFHNNNPNAGTQNSQGQGTFRFFMRSRDRFRNLLGGNNNNQGGAQGGYSYPPPSAYGTPQGGGGGDSQPPPQSDGAPGPGAGAPPPPQGQQQQQQQGGEAPAGSSNFYTNQSPNHPGTYRVQQQEFNQITIGVSHNGGAAGSHAGSSSTQSATQRTEGQNNYRGLPSPSTHNSGNHLNHQSFFGSGSQTQQQQQQHHSSGHQNVQNQNQQQQHHHQQSVHVQQQFHNNNNNQLHHTNSNNNNYNAQATSHHQSTFVPHPQSPNIQPSSYQRIPEPNQQPSIYSNNHHQQQTFPSSGSTVTRPPSILSLASTPPPIPQFKLPVPSQKTVASTQESLTQNYILTEADDPHPGFTPHSTDTPITTKEGAFLQQSFRTSARFERIGEEDTQEPSSAAENWRESF